MLRIKNSLSFDKEFYYFKLSYVLIFLSLLGYYEIKF